MDEQVDTVIEIRNNITRKYPNFKFYVCILYHMNPSPLYLLRIMDDTRQQDFRLTPDEAKVLIISENLPED